MPWTTVIGWMVAASLLVVVAAVLPQGSADDSNRPARRVLRHLVLYEFRPDASAADVQEVVDTFCALPGKIDTIIGFEHGTNVSTEGKSEGLTHAFLVTFADEQGRDAYLVHPAHEHYVSVVKDRRAKVVVFDYWTEVKP